MSVRPLSGFSDFQEELDNLLLKARSAGLEDDQLASMLREKAAACASLYEAAYDENGMKIQSL